MYRYYIFLCIAFLGTISLSICKFLGESDRIMVDLKYVRICKGNNTNSFKYNLNCRKFNRTHVAVDVNVTLPEDMGPEYEIEAELRRWGDGGWKKKTLYMRRKNACQVFYLILGPVAVYIIDAVHMRQGCPLLKGFYHFNDIHVDLSKLPVLVEEGRFFAIMSVNKDNIITACIEAEIEVKKLL